MRPQFHAQVRSPARNARNARVFAQVARRGPFASTSALIATLLLAGLSAPMTAQADEHVDRSAPLQLRAEPGSLRIDGQGWVARLDLGPVDRDRLPSRSGRVSWQLLGDYYFGALRPSPGPRSGSSVGMDSGLRATGGLIGLSPRSQIQMQWQAPAREAGTLPYLGLGYTLGLDRTGWGVKADLGLLGTRDGSEGLRLNRSGASMEDASVGDLRWLPMLQVGVSYAF
ncbi:hypothetical protein [Sphaerotilus mobilis]|uniref:Outer membrane protein n=1 Tax=Sphaerotilus mobilis TaxID=47994 RepID=A0A4Q7LCJ0_9BURK|nr:hypothetical protein [Sphaerotilus mobilis]RZS47420.1 hypothetical protein EV685_3624 [Sphaerotilus mobilis]